MVGDRHLRWPTVLDPTWLNQAAEVTGPTSELGISATLKQTQSSSLPPPPPRGKKGEFVQLNFTSQIAVLHVDCELLIT